MGCQSSKASKPGKPVVTETTKTEASQVGPAPAAASASTAPGEKGEAEQPILHESLQGFERPQGEPEALEPGKADSRRDLSAPSTKSDLDAAFVKEEALSKPGAASVKVTINSAYGLRGTDVYSEGDPYCTVEVLGKPHTRCATHAASPHAPDWHVALEVDGYEAGDSLLFSVKDSSALRGDPVLGTVTLTARQLQKGFEGEAQLHKGDRSLVAFLNIQVEAVSRDVRGTPPEKTVSAAGEDAKPSTEDGKSAPAPVHPFAGDGEDDDRELPGARTELDGASAGCCWGCGC